MIKKGLVFGIVVLFIGMSITPIAGSLSMERVSTDKQIQNFNLNDDTTPPVTDLIHDPPYPDGHDGWFISDITVSFEATDDMSGVNATYFRINEGEWETFIEPFILDSDGIYELEFYSVDNAGNVEDVNSREFKIDQTPPEIDFFYGPLKGGKYIKFYLICSDALSGLDRAELYINDEVADWDYEEPFEWIYLWSEIFGLVKIKAVVYDRAGNSDYDDYPEYRSVTVVSRVSASQQSTQQSTTLGVAGILNKNEILLDNNPPYAPSNYYPCGETEPIDLDVNLSWDGGDPDPGDTVTYDVYLDDVNPPLHRIATVGPYPWNQTRIEYDPPDNLEYCSIYYMRIDAYDNHGAFIEGSVCQFFTNCRPLAPTITGPTSPEPGQTVTFTFNAIDPDGDDVRFHIDWGDGNTDTTFYVPSGTDATVSHAWSEVGTYLLTAYAEDTHGAIGEESTFGRIIVGCPIIVVHVTELYGTPDNPQYRPLADVTVKIREGLFWMHLVWSGKTDESGRTERVKVESGFLYKVIVSKENYLVYGGVPYTTVDTYVTQVYHVDFTMVKDDSPFVQQSSQQSTTMSSSSQISRLGVVEIPINNEMLDNNPPYAPSNYYPCHEQQGISVNVNLSWDGGDPDPGDTVTYDVYFGPYPGPPKVATVGPYPWNQTRIHYDPGTLEYCSVYSMRIVAWDNHGASVDGPECWFTTRHPLEAPLIDGPRSGEAGVEYNYTFVATDPECNLLFYFIDWGDGTNTGWIGPYEAGEVISRSHSWSEDGTYIISAKVKNYWGDESSWGYLEVVMPKNQQSIPQQSQQSTVGSNSQNVMSIVPSSKTLINNGTLSGYVYDTSGNPIDGALVRVHFHETYEEDYSDEDGYYHVTNIPICYCMKNATCSKEGYETEWVLLGIVEDTTHDFILASVNNPPDKPKVTGPFFAKVGIPYECKIRTIDPDGDDVYYYIDWGDGNTTDWIGPYWYDKEVVLNHTWSEKGTYYIRAKAKDVYGYESDWGELQVTIPRNKATNNMLLLRFLEQFPLLERLMNI